MQFTQELTSANVVRSVAPGAIQVGEQILTSHVILTAATIIAPWSPERPPAVDLQDLSPALALDPEVIILGTGLTIRFPGPALVSALAERGIGIEVMDTAAACRTYNVLVHEDRAVAAALLNVTDS